MQRLVFFDLDGTIINNPSSEKRYFFWLFTNGYIKIKQLISALVFFGRWLHKFKTEIIVKNKAYLYNLPANKIIQKAEHFTITKLLPCLRPYIIERLKKHQDNNDIIILLTGAPNFIADIFAKQLNIDEIYAAEFSYCNDRFSNLPPLQHPFAQEKLVIAEKICQKYNIDIKNSIAYANSIHDLALLEKVGHPIAVTPDRRLKNIAVKKNWEIIRESN
jgi:HAD superfamily phosphoserine phosphatase-like hydrolase